MKEYSTLEWVKGLLSKEYILKFWWNSLQFMKVKDIHVISYMRIDAVLWFTKLIISLIMHLSILCYCFFQYDANYWC